MFAFLAPPDQAQSSKTMVNPRNSKIDAVISPPVSTLPHNVSGSLLNENFNPEEPQSDLYSLATATIYDVQTKSTEVPSGIPLSDALAAKGMTASPISSVYSQATPLPESAYFSPRSQDASALYAVPQKKTKLPKQHSVDAAAPDKETSPRHRPLSGTQSDAAVMRLSSQEAPGYRPAETMSNGYMRPSQWLNKPRPSNYDYVTGPPRPADGATPPHRSPLQSEDSDQVASVHEDSGSHTYINVKELHDEIRQIEAPPQIDRANKPPKPVPPTVDRGLKPGTRVSKSQTEDSDLSDSTPNFPTRTGSMSTSTPPVVDSSDLPRPTRRTMKYAHVEFDSTGQLSVVDGLAQSTPTDVSKRAPVPIPRGQNKKRVNYCQIDIAATQAMEGSSGVETHMSLNEAEAAALAEKPYVNVARDGHIDDDTDPDYYTHMRVRHTHRHAHTHTHTEAHTHAHTHTQARMLTHTHIHMHMYVCTLLLCNAYILVSDSTFGGADASATMH